MKILVATPLYPPEIAEPAPYIKQLAERWSTSHDVTVVAYANSIIPPAAMRSIAVNKRRPLPSRLFAFTMALWKASRTAEVLFAEHAVAASLPAVIVGRLRKIPVAVHFTEDETWERATQLGITSQPRDVFLSDPQLTPKLRFIRRLQRYVLRRASKVVVPSASFADLIIRTYGVKSDLIDIDENPSETPEILPFPSEPVPHQILTIGRLEPWKNTAMIIRAIQILAKEFPDVRLLIAGDGPEEDRLKELAENMNVAERILFLGQLSRAESWHLRRSSDVLVADLAHEDLPDPIVRGAVAGIPVVAMTTSAAEEVAQEISRLFFDAAYRARVVGESQRSLAERWSWDAHVPVLDRTLASLVASRLSRSK